MSAFVGIGCPAEVRRGVRVAAAKKGKRKGSGGSAAKSKGFGPPKFEKDAAEVKEEPVLGKAEVQPGMTKDELLASYGMFQSSGSTDLQKKADSAMAAEREQQAKSVSNYQRLVSIVGIENIGRLEKGLVAGGTFFLTVIILSGIGIGIEAFIKATGKPVPQGADDLLVNVVTLGFTPALILFFGCSISLGLLKSAQIDQANEAIMASQGTQAKKDS